MINPLSSIRNVTLVAIFAFAVILFSSLVHPNKAEAAYEHGRLIDNGVFLDARSMDATQIQSFFENKGAGLANMSFLVDCDSAGNQAKQIYLSLGAPCGQQAKASQIIYYATQVYGVSPKVILATMQKEQGVATAPNPTSWQINQAMGYACPTSGSCEGSSSFFYQIDNGTWVLRFHYERAKGNNTWWYSSSSWTCGTGKPSYYMPNLYPNQNVNFIDPYSGVHYVTVHIQNAATSAFYCYTPHVYNNHTNSPHPNELKGDTRCYPYSSHPATGDRGRCYTGSFNFVRFFNNWFGDTKGSNFQPLMKPRFMQIKNNDTYKKDIFTGQNAGEALNAGRHIKFIDKIYLDGIWYLRTEWNFNHDDPNYGIIQSELEEISYQAIAPKWITLTENANRSHPASRTSVGGDLVKGSSVKVTDQITVDGNLYYRTEFNKNNGDDVGIHSRFVTDFAPVSLDGPRNFCTNTSTSKFNPQTGEVVNSVTPGTYLINRKTLVNGAWYFQASSDNNTLNFFKASDLRNACYQPLESPREMKLNQETTRFNPYTNEKYDTLAKDLIIHISSKILIGNTWYFRTTNNTQNNFDAVIPSSSLSEL